MYLAALDSRLENSRLGNDVDRRDGGGGGYLERVNIDNRVHMVSAEQPLWKVQQKAHQYSIKNLPDNSPQKVDRRFLASSSRWGWFDG